MTPHEQFGDDLALLAMGALQGDDRVALEKHLAGCAACRRELEQLRGDTALLAFSAIGPTPPARSRERLLKAIAAERWKTGMSSVRAPRRSWTFMPWLAAAAFALIAVFFFRQSDRLAQRVAELQDQSTQQQAEIERAREVVSTLTSTNAQRVTLVTAQAPPQPQGKAIYVRNRSSLVFIASNMPALPAQKAYELWLIPTTGAPIPAGVFKPDAHGSATVVEPPLPAGADAKAFAITVEPEQGSTTPTMPIFMSGAGE
jgi:anti-sigma-K factor RskA